MTIELPKNPDAASVALKLLGWLTQARVSTAAIYKIEDGPVVYLTERPSADLMSHLGGHMQTAHWPGGCMVSDDFNHWVVAEDNRKQSGSGHGFDITFHNANTYKTHKFSITGEAEALGIPGMMERAMRLAGGELWK